MTLRDGLGMLFILSGMAIGSVAWTLQAFWYGMGGAVLLTVGFAVIWTRERHDRLKGSARDVHDEGLGWRVRGRRGDSDADGGLFDAGDD